MRLVLLSAVGAALAVVAASASAGGRGTVATLSIKLPPAGQAKISEVALQGSAAPSPTATNAARLGSRLVNTQAVVAWRTTSPGHYLMLVFIHRFPSAARRLADGNNTVEIALGHSYLVNYFIDVVGCKEVGHQGYLSDTFLDEKWQFHNLVPIMDTGTEEQIDGAVYAKCVGAEKPDPGTK